MSATGTAMAKKSGQATKGQAAAQEAAAKIGAVVVPIGNGGYTLVNKAEANRRKLVDAEKAKLAAETPAEPVVETTEQVIAREVAEGKLTPVGPAPKVKAPYNPEKLSGAAPAGKQPGKGQLPAGLLAYLAKKHAGSQIIAAAESGAPVKATKKGKAKK